MPQMNKSTSLKEMGFKVEPIRGQDAKGNEWAFRVRGPEPVYFIKKTKRGKLLAFREKTEDANATDVTIHGLYDFQEKNGDLVGRRNQQSTNTGNRGRKAA